MNSIPKSLLPGKNLLAGAIFKAAAALPLAAATTTAAEAQQATALEAYHILLPHEVVLMNKKATPEQRKTASDAIYDAQRKLDTFFGPGSEMDVTFTHKGHSYTVPIDLDAATLRFSPKGFVLMATPALIEPAHQAIQAGMNFSPEQLTQENQIRKRARSQFIPLSHPQAKGYITHLKTVHEFDVKTVWKEIIEPSTPGRKSLSVFLDEKDAELAKALNLPSAPQPPQQ